MDDYTRKIKGKRIVINAMSAELRRELDVPADLSGWVA